MFHNSIMFVIKHEPVSEGLSASFTSFACSTSKKKEALSNVTSRWLVTETPARCLFHTLRSPQGLVFPPPKQVKGTTMQQQGGKTERFCSVEFLE